MKFFKLLVPLLLVASLAQAEVWSTTNEGNAGATGSIENSSAPSTIDDHIRQTRQQVRKRMGVEHHFGDGDGTADDNGMHRLGSAKCYFQATAPTSLNDSQTSADIALYDNTTETEYTGSKDLNDLANNAASHLENDVGTGRCWIDSDDNNQLYIYRGVAGNDTPSTIAEGWEPVNQARGYLNLIGNGSFENTDGTGVLAIGDFIPVGWTATGGPAVYAYIDTAVYTEGDGFQLKTTTGAAATDQGVTQIIGGLEASAQYRFRVRALAASGDTCQLAVTGQGSVIPSAAEAETTGETWETLELLATTDASATDLVFALRGPDNDDICTWDHAEVVQIKPVLHAPLPNVIVFYNSSSFTTTCGAAYTADCDDIVSITVTPPGPGYYLRLSGKVGMNPDADAKCWLELWDETNGVQYDEVFFDEGSGDNSQGQYLYVERTLPITQTAGVSTVWTMNGKDTGTCIPTGVHTLEGILFRGGGG